MFGALGRSVVRFWPAVLLAWAVLLAAVFAVRPAWSEVTADGEFAFLPPDAPSLEAERLFREAFSADLLRSSVVIVVSRPSRPAGLTGSPGDDDFLRGVLLPELKRTLVAGGFAAPDLTVGPDDEPPDRPDAPADGAAAPGPPPPVAAVLTPFDRVVGPLFESPPRNPPAGRGRAALIVLGLRTEFGEAANGPLLDALEDLVGTDDTTGRLVREGERFPAGIELDLSGTAVVGRDIRVAELESGRATHLASVVLVVGLLLAIYRAPLLALVPLLTVAAGVELAVGLLAIAADAGWFAPFAGLEIYITVVAYGAGVDYCMFLTARYREELDRAERDHAMSASAGRGAAWGDALAAALGKVGPALAASAGTTIVGIGMMTFAEFGKYRQAGAGIVTGLAVVTLASLTFAPAALRLLGPWAFWPRVPHGRPAEEGGFLEAAGPLSSGGALTEAGGRRALRRFWAAAAGRVCDAPGRWLLGALAAMLPLAALGYACQDDLTYGLLSELPDDAESVRGAKVVRKYFPAGETGPVTVLLSVPARPAAPGRGGSESRAGLQSTPAATGGPSIAELTDRLWDAAGRTGAGRGPQPVGPAGGRRGRPAAGRRRAAAAAGCRRFLRRGGAWRSRSGSITSPTAASPRAA